MERRERGAGPVSLALSSQTGAGAVVGGEAVLGCCFPSNAVRLELLSAHLVYSVAARWRHCRTPARERQWRCLRSWWLPVEAPLLRLGRRVARAMRSGVPRRAWRGARQHACRLRLCFAQRGPAGATRPGREGSGGEGETGRHGPLDQLILAAPRLFPTPHYTCETRGPWPSACKRQAIDSGYHILKPYSNFD